MKKILFLLLMLIVTSCMPPERSTPMGVDLSNTAGQQVKWPDGNPLEGLTKFTYNIWVSKDAYYTITVSKIIELGNIAAIGTLGNERFTLLANDTGGLHAITMYRNWSGSIGIWQISTNPFTTGAVVMITVTYDGTSSANVPLIYYNAVSQAVSVSSAPSGSLSLTGADGFSIGALTATVGVDEQVLGLTAYNRIAAQAEITDWFNGRKMVPTYNGLVFAPNMLGTAGGLKDGDTMAAGNTIRDIISGLDGVPAGSPVFRINNFMRIGGE